MPLYAVRSALMILVLGACTDAEPADNTIDSDVHGDDTADTQDTAVSLDLALTVTPLGADDLNPHGDGSGEVLLTATANGVDRYIFSVDGGQAIESTTGQVQVTIEEEGTTSVTFQVTGYTSTGEGETVTQTVTVYRSTAQFPRLVWADEFDGSGPPDADKWLAQTLPPLDGGWFNGEQQHYTDRLVNAQVSEGTLKITARKESYTVQGSRREYTSARLNSTFPFTYGRVEVRAKLPPQGGTWPAIWTLGANINELGNPFGTTYGDVGWPACGEIDIMEQRGWDKNTTIAYFHWGDTETGIYASEGGDLSVPTSTSAFHIYALDWTETSLRVYVDDALVYELPNDRGRPYDNPHYLLLNIAMGGNLGGDIPGDFTQAVMEVDYVRVYQ